MSKWARVRLGDCCRSISDGDHLPPPKTDSGIPFVTISDIHNNRFDLSNTRFVPEAYYEAIDQKRKIQKGDVLYSVVGSYGIPVFANENLKVAFQRHIAILRPSGEIEPRFLYYSMLNRDFFLKADAVAVGAAQKTITLAALRGLEIALPPLPIQRRIAAILSDYDSAIDNARRQIALLEEAAMRLYREWFGDGKGERKPLGEFIEITTSGSWGTDTKTVKTPNEVVCIRGADFEDIHGRSLGKQIRRFISDKHLVERSLKDGDLVVEMSGGSPTQSTGRVVSISDMLLARYGVPVLATNFCKVVRPKSGYSRFLYLAWRDLYVSRIMFNYEVGTTGIKNFDYDLFVSDVEITNPLPKLTQFNGLVDGMFSSMDMLGSLVQDLTEARDRLLPKLMSGEIEV